MEEISQIKKERLEHFKSGYSASTRELLVEAAEYRSVIESAKTTVKKNFYKKKLAKLNQQVIQSLVTLDQIDKMMSVYDETEESIDGE